jgi:hypothetical protein
MRIREEGLCSLIAVQTEPLRVFTPKRDLMGRYRTSIQQTDLANHPNGRGFTTTKKSSAKKSSKRKYSKSASKSVETEMKARKKGKLHSGKSGKKVTSKKQAIAIGLSKARKKGKKVPKKES